MRQIASYEHNDKDRANNPPAGLVTPDTDPDGPTQTYAYDPHLAPQLVWAGKAEHTSFAVPTVSLHVHERIDPRTIIEAVRRPPDPGAATQLSLFGAARENPPLRQAIEFYRHRHGWSNRLIAGDSLLVMNSLLEKEGLAGQVQMVYIDPPYGIKYGSNFQPFVQKRKVVDGKDDDLSAEPETIRAFRDTWELGFHSYLTYLRDRLLLTRELLHPSGCCFLQINAENAHYVTQLMVEVFGEENLIANIVFRKKSIPLGSKYLETMHDHLIFFARDKSQLKYRHLFEEGDVSAISSHGPYAVYPDGSFEIIEPEDFRSPSHPKGTRYCRLFSLLAPSYSAQTDFDYEFDGKLYPPPSRGCWVVSKEKLDVLKGLGRLQPEGNSLSYRLFYDDFPFRKVTASWQNVGVSYKKVYAVQTSPSVLARCILMTTDPGDLVFDPTCGSGTTAYVAEQWGRRWISCDTSRVAVTLAKQRLMTAAFDYYELARPGEGVGSGFRYKTVPHVTLKSIANNPDIREGLTRAQIDAAIARHAPQETLYDQPYTDKSRARVTGPFTVEAVPAPTVQPLDDGVGAGLVPAHDDTAPDRADTAPDRADTAPDRADTRPAPTAASAARSGETLRQREWRDELFRTGIRGKGGQRIAFARLEPLPGARWLNAEGETRPDASGAAAIRESGPEYATAINPLRVVVSFGPEHAPLEQRQVEHALLEAGTLRPPPRLLVFAAFQFDPEASKDIDETNWPGVTLLKAQMAPDLFTDDLKKKRAGNESFWLIGQPDVEVAPQPDGQVRVSVTASTTSTPGRARSNRAGRTRSPCGCSTPTTTAAASSRGRCSSRWPATRRAGRGWPAT